MLLSYETDIKDAPAAGILPLPYKDPYRLCARHSHGSTILIDKLGRDVHLRRF